MTDSIEPRHVGDPVKALLAVVSAIEPTVCPEEVVIALQQAAVRPDGQRRVAEEIVSCPALLTGKGASAVSPGVLRFIYALVREGARTVVEPPCPRCGKQRKLGRPFDGVRLCAGCTRKALAVRCHRCQQVKPPARRDDNGEAICQPCWWRDPRSWKVCAGCGHRRRVAAITDSGPVCQVCRPRPELRCSICDRPGRGTISKATGKPMCDRCRERWIVCSGCGTGASLKGGTLQEPLCARCLNPDPAFWKRCGVCKITWQLTTAECIRCSLERRLSEVFTPADGTIGPELDQLRQTLVRVERPDNALTWLSRARNRTVLRAVVTEHRQVSHESLDAMSPSNAVTHLRSMLVAAGALEPRDERLHAAERWIAQEVAVRGPLQHQRVLHGYAVWHHLRRLRSRLAGAPASHLQIRNVRSHVTAAITLLDWLERQSLTLETCTQAEFEQWLADQPRYPERTAHFVRWAMKHRHVTGLTAPALRWNGPSGALDQDRRWADARRLLHDDSYAVADRVAGLLVLLYAQKLNVICELTTSDVSHQTGRTVLALGSRPAVLPAPLDGLVDSLLTMRKSVGSGLIDMPSNWLFPGRWPGRPLTEGALARRLQAIGLHSRQSRNTALFTLASEVPAAILAKMLGLHIKSAIQWQKASAGDWAAYAADVSRRSGTLTDAPAHDTEQGTR
ncbi:site-specific integrase [Streptomyces sp. NPDC059909]|uniref:site-specific integrase n=1 Tax=Streptomyces sp. NPDC059909 TaxID=3346998 RepID=UPI0036571F02